MKNLFPLILFVTLFLGTGIYYNDFYAFPAPIAALVGVLSAYFILPGTIKSKTEEFLTGCGDKNILTMCFIYLLAGAFAFVSKQIGSVDAVVALGIHFIAPEFYTAGIFVIASFLSIASGTSVGTIVALGPIVMGLASTSGGDVNIMAAALLCGAMFGDNLSVISDTTIAATQILGCSMKDKFRNNIQFALPAALMAVLFFLYLGYTTPINIQPTEALQLERIILIVPYVLVIALAFIGVDVFLVLIAGIVFSGILGAYFQGLSFLEFGKSIYSGFTSMTDIFLLSLLTGGLAYMVQQTGVINNLILKFKTKIKNSRKALLSIGGLVSLTDAAVANNTIAIIVSGNIAKEISESHNIKPKATASVLDTFSCIVQGFIPYGAQVLILIGFSNGKIDYLSLVLNSYYLYFLLIAVLLYIRFGKIYKVS